MCLLGNVITHFFITFNSILSVKWWPGHSVRVDTIFSLNQSRLLCTPYLIKHCCPSIFRPNHRWVNELMGVVIFRTQQMGNLWCVFFFTEKCNCRGLLLDYFFFYRVVLVEMNWGGLLDDSCQQLLLSIFFFYVYGTIVSNRSSLGKHEKSCMLYEK